MRFDQRDEGLLGGVVEALADVFDALWRGKGQKKGERDGGKRTDDVKLDDACRGEIDELQTLRLGQVQLLELVEKLADRLVGLPSQRMHRFLEVTQSLQERKTTAVNSIVRRRSWRKTDLESDRVEILRLYPLNLVPRREFAPIPIPPLHRSVQSLDLL